MKLAKWQAAEKDFCKQTGLDRIKEESNFQKITLSQYRDYMASFVPEFAETQKIHVSKTDLLIRRVRNSRFSLWAETSLKRKNGSISIMERYMRQIQSTLPEDFEIPKMAVVDFDKHGWNPNAIGGYQQDAGILFFNSKYDIEAKILGFLRKNEGEFANTTVLSPFLHELGHKYHYDLIQQLAKHRNWSYNKAETYMESSIMDYVRTQKAMDPSFVSKQISERATDGFKEMMAEWFASSKDSDLGRFISDFVRGVNV